MRSMDRRLGNVRFMVLGIILLLLATMWVIWETMR